MALAIGIAAGLSIVALVIARELVWILTFIERDLLQIHDMLHRKLQVDQTNNMQVVHALHELAPPPRGLGADWAK